MDQLGIGITSEIKCSKRQTPSSRSMVYFVCQQPILVNADLLDNNNRLESRVREIRQSGSVGGELQPNASSLPQSISRDQSWIYSCSAFAVVESASHERLNRFISEI